MVSRAPLVTKAGRVYAKGCGLFGALGVSDLLDYSSFKLIDPSIRARSIATGWAHSAIITDDDKLLICGRPYELNTLLRMNFIHRISPVLGRLISKSSDLFGADSSGLYTVPTDFNITEKAVAVSCSAGLTAVVTKKGSVYCFGLNKFGQCAVTEKKLHVYSPSLVNIPKSIAVDTGFQHCVGLTADGHVYSWGKGRRGQLGTDVPQDFTCTPVLVKTIANTVAISAGFNHSAALCSDGSVYVWGKHMSTTTKKSAMVDLFEDQLTPRKVDLPIGLIAVEICSSNFNLVIRCSNGSLWAIGLGERDRNCNPIPLPVLSDFNVNLNTELANQDIPVIVSNDTVMRRGYTRVVVIDSDRNCPFDVIVHNKEAYAREVEGTEESNARSRRIIDYSSGWKHSLMIAEEN